MLLEEIIYNLFITNLDMRLEVALHQMRMFWQLMKTNTHFNGLIVYLDINQHPTLHLFRKLPRMLHIPVEFLKVNVMCIHGVGNVTGTDNECHWSGISIT